MGKGTKNVFDDDDVVEESEESGVEVSNVVQFPEAGSIPLWKYFELYEPAVDKYHKAYLGGLYQGQVKPADEWAAEVKKHVKE